MIHNKTQSRKRTLEVDEIIKLYKEGRKMTEIAALSSISVKGVDYILRKNGVERRKRGSWKRKYTLNEDYFKTWSNNMAYILGFITADGCINKDIHTISISQKERDILEDIRDELGSNSPLTKNDKTGVYLLNLHSKVMKEDLITLHGITPNKSKSIQFPIIPDQYISHYIRGYFDGDGFVNYPKYFVSFVGGSLSFMTTLKKKIEERGFGTNFTSHGTYYRLYISGRKTIKLFSDWIYKDKGIFLKRKYDQFQQEKLSAHLLDDSKNKISTKKEKIILIYSITKDIKECLNQTNTTIDEYRKWLENDPIFRNKMKGNDNH